MTKTATNITVEDDAMILPLHHLITKLRQNGFVIRPEDYIEILKVVERFGANEKVDAYLLCPLIATSPEEQEKFYKVFEEYEKEHRLIDPPPPPIKYWLQKNKWWVVGGILLLVLAAAYFWSQSKKTLVLKGDITYEKLSAGDAVLRVGDTIELSAKNVFDSSFANDRSLNFFWNTGQGFETGDPTKKTVLTTEGEAAVQFKLASEKFRITDSIRKITFTVCPSAPYINFIFNKENYAIGDVLRIQPVYLPGDSTRFSRTAWKLNNAIVLASADGSFQKKLDSAGAYKVEFFGFLTAADNENVPCTYIKTFDNIVITDNRYSLQTTSVGSPLISAQHQLHPIINWLLLVPAFIIGLGTFIWWKRKGNNKKEKGEETPPQFSGRKPPYETPFENKDLKLTEPESEFREVFRSFRQKAEDELTIFNVPQSIQRTIRGGGMPELIFTNKLRYTDYVILIDRTLAKSMQVRLFEYLVKLLNEEAITVERFYYTGNFEKIFNEETPDGYTFKRLAELYKSHTLIIMGNAHQLIYSAYPVLDKQLSETLAEWEYKAILTPVAYHDWEEKETLIAQKFILLPADLQGQLKLIQAIREKTLDHKKYLSSIASFYEAGSFDFGDIEQVKDYLQDEVLFQWLCAITVYHKLRWEVVIEIGKTICSAYKQREKMNFTNLLKFSRIHWMVEGAFPAAIRLELLKHLTPENEMLARETLLRMLQYADTYFGKDHFFQEEKEVQKLTSRFLLHAHEPSRFPEYTVDEQQFKVLWDSGKLWDTAQKVYLENPDGKWSTLLQPKGKSAGVDEYFQTKKGKGLKTQRQVLWRNGLIAASLILILGLLHLFKNSALANTPLVKSTHTDALLTIVVSDSITCESTNAVQSLQGRLQLDNGKEYELTFNNQLQSSVIIQENLLSDSTGILEINGNNGQSFTTTSLVKLSSDTLQVTLSACVARPAYTVNIVYNDSSRSSEVDGLAAFLNQQGYIVKNVAYEPIDSATSIYYFTDAETNGADSLAQLLSLQYSSLFASAIPKKEPSLDFGQQKTLGIIINFKPRNIQWNLSKLDNRLFEIWRGGTSNRLITLSSSLLYYSTGNKKTYGTYRIDEVWSNNNGMYRIITRTNPQYQTFFIRNVQRNSFELSVCQNRYNTKEEARVADETYCDHFNAMNLYYEKDDSKIFLPLNTRSQLERSNEQKLNRLRARLNELNKQQTTKTTLTGKLFYNDRFKWEMPGNLLNPIVQTIAIPNETPFDRSFVQYTFNYTPDNNPPNQPVTQSPERFLTRVQSNAKAYPDAKAQSVLKQIVAYANKNSNARVRMEFYNEMRDEKMIQLFISQMSTYLKNLGYNPRQFEMQSSRVKDMQQSQQNNIPYNNSTGESYAEIFGTNFPSVFLQPRAD